MCHDSSHMTGAKRVPGHPIGNCAGSSNNLVPRGAKLSAIDVKAKAFFERLYLVLGLAPICALSQLSVCSHAPTVYSAANSQFSCSFFLKWPSPGQMLIIPASLSLPLLRGAAVNRAPTIFQNDWFCTRISDFVPNSIFLIARLLP